MRDAGLVVPLPIGIRTDLTWPISMLILIYFMFCCGLVMLIWPYLTSWPFDCGFLWSILIYIVFSCGHLMLVWPHLTFQLYIPLVNFDLHIFICCLMMLVWPFLTFQLYIHSFGYSVRTCKFDLCWPFSFRFLWWPFCGTSFLTLLTNHNIIWTSLNFVIFRYVSVL